MSINAGKLFNPPMESKISHRAAYIISNYVALTKPKIQVMLLFTELCAMIVADHGMPNLRTAIAALFGLALSGAGSAAINMWYDRDIDAIMQRTANRPIPAGRVRTLPPLVYGIVLTVVSVLVLWLYVNPLSAALSGAGALYYAVVYTMWLKRRTPQNIVIGGGAGAFPPLVGWAAVTGHIGLAPIIMFAIIFFWTPPHFWALALYKNEDYTRAGVPMMPVVRGATSTKIQSLIYTVVLTATAVSLYFTGYVGSLYTTVAVIVNLIFLGINVRLFFEPNTSMKWAKRTFVASIVYLPIVFLVMIINVR